MPTFIKDLGRLHEGLRMLETCGSRRHSDQWKRSGRSLRGGSCCHHRIAAGQAKLDCLSELGLVAGGGGCQRLPRLIGIQPAEVIAQGQMLRVDKALKKESSMQSHLTKP